MIDGLCRFCIGCERVYRAELEFDLINIEELDQHIAAFGEDFHEDAVDGNMEHNAPVVPTKRVKGFQSILVLSVANYKRTFRILRNQAGTLVPQEL